MNSLKLTEVEMGRMRKERGGKRRDSLNKKGN